MIVIIAEKAGACYGVERALDLVAEANEGESAVHTLGPLIHNPGAVADLEAAGVSVADSVADIGSGTVVIRSHGVPPQVIEEAHAAGLDVVDATCPFVTKVHRAAKKLTDEGYRVLIVGEEGHPEVEGIFAHADGKAIVIGSIEDLLAVDPKILRRRLGIVVQTTQSQGLLKAVIDHVLPLSSEIRIFNTICSATAERQQAAADLASRAEVMIVIGGKNSGNTRRLYEICKERCEATYHIEDVSELDPAWFEGVEVVGVTAGASTPSSQITAVVDALAEY